MNDKLFCSSIEVRFTDQDSQGHVNHVAIVEWVSHVRIRFIDQMLYLARVKDLDYVLVHIDVDFDAPIRYPAVVDIEASVDRIGSKSLITYYELKVKGELVAVASCVNVFFDRETKKTVESPQALKDVM